MKQNVESSKKITSKYSPIDTTNDLLMVKEGIRPPRLQINYNVFKKESWEKKEVKKWKHLKISKGLGHIIEPYALIPGTLTIYYENMQKDSTFKTTESIKCFKNEILSIIQNKWDNYRLKVKKYYFKY